MPKAKNKKVNKDVTIYQQSLTIADMRMERQYGMMKILIE